MNDFRADLHSHSVFSDGTNTPEELIDIAIGLGHKGLSITDHDTIAAYERAIPYAKKRGILLLPGVEFSSFYKEESIHVLCYGFAMDSPPIALLCQKHKERREKRNKKILEKLAKMHIRISDEEIVSHLPGGMIGRPHIALALVKKGVVKSIKEAFAKYLGEGKPAYDKGESISLEDTLSVISQSGGKSILAHPMLIKRKRLFKELLEKPFDGLEGYYCLFPSDQEDFYLEKAREKHWIITGGSDFHGQTKPHVPYGCSWVNEETFFRLAHDTKTL